MNNRSSEFTFNVIPAFLTTCSMFWNPLNFGACLERIASNELYNRSDTVADRCKSTHAMAPIENDWMHNDLPTFIFSWKPLHFKHLNPKVI